MCSDYTDSRNLLAGWSTGPFSQQLSILCLLAVTVCIKVVHANALTNRITGFIPESLLLICLGAGIGALMVYVLPEELDGGFWRITPEVFFHYLLPATVLDAAYNLYNRSFGETIVAVVVYAVVATVLNMLLIGAVLIGMEYVGLFSSGGFAFGTRVLLLYASFIVAVDPVAVLAIFQEIGVDASLYYLALGESLFNDAVTLVLYKILTQFLTAPSVTHKDILIGVGAFFTISLGAIVVGIVMGAAACLLTKHVTRFELFFLLSIAYASYVLTDVLGWSGLVALITCAMVEAAYAFHNVEENTLNTIRCVTHQVSELCEGIIFLLIGVKVVEKHLFWHMTFNLWSLLACLLVRALVVFLLTFYLNRFDLNFSIITLTDQFILSYGGLRGAVALSLAIMVDREKLNGSSRHVYDTLVTSTLFTIVFTVGVMGPTMRPLVRVLRVKLAERKTISLVRELTGRMIDEMTAGVESMVGRVGRNALRAWFVRLDEEYIRSFLQRDPDTYNAGIVRVYAEMALILHHASLQPPNRAAAMMRNLPMTIQTRQIELMLREQRKSQRARRRMLSTTNSFLMVGHFRRRNAAIACNNYGVGGGNKDCVCERRIYGYPLVEIPKFLEAKKALVLSMSSQVADSGNTGMSTSTAASSEGRNTSTVFQRITTSTEDNTNTEEENEQKHAPA